MYIFVETEGVFLTKEWDQIVDLTGRGSPEHESKYSSAIHKYHLVWRLLIYMHSFACNLLFAVAWLHQSSEVSIGYKCNELRFT